MTKVGFIGIYDKLDMILNVAKVLQLVGKNVLIVDATNIQKARYTVPSISPTFKYVTNFEEFDVAVGFESLQEVYNYLGLEEQEEQESTYDILLVDCDSTDSMKKFKIAEADNKYFVTAFDNYSLKRGLEIFNRSEENIELRKILYSKNMLKEENDYLNFLAAGLDITWKTEIIYFPIENGDLTEIMENQRVAKIKFKKLSQSYKDSIEYLATEIARDCNQNRIRKVMKNLERGV